MVLYMPLAWAKSDMARKSITCIVQMSCSMACHMVAALRDDFVSETYGCCAWQHKHDPKVLIGLSALGCG